MVSELEKTAPMIPYFFKTAAPAGRLGVPEDLNPMITYLLSDAGSFTTGSDMKVEYKYSPVIRERIELVQVGRANQLAKGLDLVDFRCCDRRCRILRDIAEQKALLLLGQLEGVR